ncbi:unnamed protein product [Pleuronectes platessa]|uniref:Uncharacterized protein n=1 Tax=Pleuronectes platessa TaxID=8262 RepID=A0A9N7YAS6_PLEPL|nr:unnamed protein product [Pleuronectes platessa]
MSSPLCRHFAGLGRSVMRQKRNNDNNSETSPRSVVSAKEHTLGDTYTYAHKEQERESERGSGPIMVAPNTGARWAAACNGAHGCEPTGLTVHGELHSVPEPGLPPIAPCKKEPFEQTPRNITGSKKFQVFCSPEWRHPIGRDPINHAFSRTPPPIQPLASLFHCVYYTAEHKGDTRLHMH